MDHDKFLHRSDAPFHEDTWSHLDNAVKYAALGMLSVRRILRTQGPFGLGLKSLPANEQELEDDSGNDIEISLDQSLPVPLISRNFSLPARSIDNFETYGYPMNLKPATDAALACARKEEQLLYYGMPEQGIPGLLTSKEVQTVKLRTWKEVGESVEDIIGAVNKLDAAGYRGPYALALSPARYNNLFRRYPDGDNTEMVHMRDIVTEGIVKAPALEEGGVLIASGQQYASIILGQDLMTAFEGPEGRSYTFVLSESLVLRLTAPKSICRLQ